ncbi:MAG: ABC transporter permease [Candidatus Rokubacteria bacterium]|nr:ABC transporter permease [Candidatus Rokubacteria bacterium]
MGARLALSLMGGSVLAFLLAPILFVIPMSFSSSMVFELIPTQPGLEQYHRFFASSEWMLALFLSFQVAIGAMLVATCLGTLSALGLVRVRHRWRPVIEAFLISPRIVPSIVFAVASYYLYSQVGLVGSVTGLVLAHAVLAFPFVVVLVTSALYSFDRSLEEASKSLGAGPIRTFFRITFPHIRLAVFGGALFAFNVSFDEVVVTLFISGVRTKTLPVKVWDAILYEITPILPAISALIIVASLLMLSPVLFFYRRRSSI